MAFSIFFSLTVIVAVSFAVTPKNLHPFEMFFLWMITVVIHHNFIAIIATNLNFIDFSHQPANYWAFVFIRVALIPLLIVYYFDRMVAHQPYRKWVWLPLGILILTGSEYVAEWLRLYTFTRWKLWWSLVEWLVLFLLVHFPWLSYRKWLTKGAA